MLNKIITRNFAAVTKNPKMKLTIRTPYKTVVEDLEDFVRVKAKAHYGALNIQNRTPPSLHVLPPGLMNVVLSKDIDGFNGEIYHNGAFVAVHPDNSCEINLMEMFNKEDLKPEMLGTMKLAEDEDSVAANYINQIREKTKNTFSKKLV